MGAGVAHQPRLDFRVDGGAVLHAQRIGAEIGVAAQLGRADRLDQLGIDHLGARRDRHLAVARAEETVRGDDAVIVAGAPRHLAAGEVVGGEEAVKADEPVGQAGAHRVAAAGSPASDQSRADAERAVEPGDEVADRRAGAHGLVARLAGDAHEATHRLGDEVEGRAVAIGAADAEAGDVAIDEVGLELFQPRRAEPHLVEDAGAVILDQHIALADQPRQHLAPLGRAQIEGDRPLVAVIGGEIPAQPVAYGALMAHRIALAGRFHLDDVGAHIGEQHRAERAGEDAGEVENANSAQGQDGLPIDYRCFWSPPIGGKKARRRLISRPPTASAAPSAATPAQPWRAQARPPAEPATLEPR